MQPLPSAIRDRHWKREVMMTAEYADERRPLLDNITRYNTLSVDIELNSSQARIKKAPFYSWKGLWVSATINSTKTFGRRRQTSERIILQNVTGIVIPGELTVILGPSGSGKTTLLNALTFRATSGTIVIGDRLVNGRGVDRVTMTALSAYVQQQDIFLGCLTVREHLIFQAMTRMSDDVSHRRKMIRVEQVLDELGLRKCEKTMILPEGSSTGISGGERKKLALASEVLTDPPILFCDEPTSGLDSVSAMAVMSLLKNLSRKGKIVVCTVHQPSSEMYAMFDKILLLSEGRTAFLGSPDEASTFFSSLGVPCPVNYNPADFYVQLLSVSPDDEDLCKDNITLVCDFFEESSVGAKLLDDVVINRSDEPQMESLPSPYRTKWTTQFSAVFWRSWLCITRDPAIVKTRLFQNVVVSSLIAALYFQQEINEDSILNINGVLFTFLTNMTFQNMYAVIMVFCSERPIFLREHLSGLYRVDVYFLCKTLAEIPMFLFMPITFSMITYYTIGLNPGINHFFTAMLIVVLVANTATSFGYLVSSVSSSVTMALSIGPPIIIPFLLFGGFLLNTRFVPSYLDWLSYLSWFRYGNEALLINQWSDIAQIKCRTPNSTCPNNGTLVLDIYNFSADRLAYDIFALFVLIIVFRLLAFFALFWKTIFE